MTTEPSAAAKFLFPIIVLSNFTAGLAMRALDPVLPQISQDLVISASTAAMLVAAAAVSYAIMQLPLGTVADLYGKPRVLLVCLVALGLSNILGVFASSYESLFATRLLCGIAAGGTTPVAVSLTADLFPLAQRRIATSRLLAGVLTGQLLGASLSGIIADFVGWRGVLAVLGALVLISSMMVAWGFRHQLRAAASKQRTSVIENYRSILSHPNARLCYFGAFCEGASIIGIIPFIAAFLADSGEPRSSIAGYVISGFAVGGLIYAAMVKRLLVWFGDTGLMRIGAVMAAVQLIAIGFTPPWQVQFVIMMLLGYGLYAIHGGLLLFTSEVVPHARASAMSLQACCFNIGQFVGPIVYGVSVPWLGKLPSMIGGALVILTAGFICARLLRHRPHAESAVS